MTGGGRSGPRRSAKDARIAELEAKLALLEKVEEDFIRAIRKGHEWAKHKERLLWLLANTTIDAQHLKLERRFIETIEHIDAAREGK